ncbi:MAG: aminotransferase class V-fold PLP-dependent enzyme [Proteobacteria bacterium]|uniref:Aminotransferase class V-fold PLP-dependent enzyme n=1 Tax=Candidatus Enterousia excrementavium TaxID=2840789 RepID=A0A940DDW2_9PROT|nr:aminotransferase class V-fold PLP-dependent enzyme [Candidatus Enterousia excrementavium]
MNNIIYLDSAASALKPESVIAAECDFLRHDYANAGRGICARASNVDDMVAKARARAAQFINARPDQIVFTSGTTDGMNRIVHIINDCVCRAGIKNKTVMVSDLDHHSARLPFELLYDSDLCKIVLCPMDDKYNLMCSDLPRADVFVITAMSNVMGVAQDVAGLIAAARRKNPDVITVVDAAQYVVHDEIDVQKWDCDFMCFSAHKIGADTGLGIMYMKNPERWVSPDKFGGGMISKITGSAVEHNVMFQWENAPAKFEAGTLPVTQIIGLPAAMDYLSANRPNLDLIKYLYDRLSENARIKIITSRDAALLTFYIDGMHILDFGALVGARGLCLRVGNMCASWIHKAFGVAGTARISVGSTNTMDDAVRAADIIESVVK